MNIADTTAGGPGGSADPAADAKQAAGSIKEAASSTLDAVKQETASFADAAQKRAVEEIEARKGLVGSLLGDLATGLRKAGEETERNDRTGMAGPMRQAAEQLESLAGKVADRPAGELVDMTREFARANPVPFAAGTLLVGFALGRFFRSSARHDESGDAAGSAAPSVQSGRSGLEGDRGVQGGIGGTSSMPGAHDDALANRGSGSDTLSAARIDGDSGFGAPGAGEGV